MDKELQALCRIYNHLSAEDSERFKKDFELVEKAIKNSSYQTEFVSVSLLDAIKSVKAFNIIKELDIFKIVEDENGYHIITNFDICRINKEKAITLEEVLINENYSNKQN